MKQRLADYVADFLVARGVTDVFSPLTLLNGMPLCDMMKKRNVLSKDGAASSVLLICKEHR